MSNYDELPETFDPAAHKGTGFECIPAGWYSAHIIEAEVREASTGNGTYLFATFEVLEGDHRLRKVFQNITLQNANQQAVEIGAHLLKEIYESIGHAGPTKSISILLFKPVMARLGIKRDKDGVFPDRNAVTSVKPPDYRPKRGPGSGPGPSGTATPFTTPHPASSPAPGIAPATAPATPTATPSGSAPWRS